MIADRIRYLRNRQGLSQTELARLLNITRSSVNAWELGISMPSTSNIITLTHIFHVSADYLLELEKSSHSPEDILDLTEFTQDEKDLIFHLINYINSSRSKT